MKNVVYDTLCSVSIPKGTFGTRISDMCFDDFGEL